MTFTDFCEKLMIALYQDGHRSDRWISVVETVERYGLEAELTWHARAVEFLTSQGWTIERNLSGLPTSQMAQITGAGIVYIEQKYGDKDGVGQILVPVERITIALDDDESGDATELYPTDYLNDRVAPPPSNTTGDARTSTDSSAWTGLPKAGILTDNAAQRLKTVLKVVEDAVSKSNASNEENAQARAYAMAIHALADAPSPPADLIWNIISRANSLSGVASLFVSLIALFQTAIH